MRILSWNVNGIRAGERKGFLDWLQADQPDILGIQETKAHREQLSDALLYPEGYETYFHSGERKGYSGVAIYTKHTPKEVYRDFGTKILNDEGRMIMAEYENFYYICTYYPNGKRDQERLQYKLDFYAAFLDFITELKKEGKPIVFAGDVNTAHHPIDLARPKANIKISGFLPEERVWQDKFLEAGFVDSLREFNEAPELYTWWDMKSRARDRNVGWRIDYVYVQNELRDKLKDAYIMPEVMGSDHCPVGVTFDGLL